MHQESVQLSSLQDQLNKMYEGKRKVLGERWGENTQYSFSLEKRAGDRFQVDD